MAFYLQDGKLRARGGQGQLFQDPYPIFPLPISQTMDFAVNAPGGTSCASQSMLLITTFMGNINRAFDNLATSTNGIGTFIDENDQNIKKYDPAFVPHRMLQFLRYFTLHPAPTSRPKGVKLEPGYGTKVAITTDDFHLLISASVMEYSTTSYIEKKTEQLAGMVLPNDDFYKIVVNEVAMKTMVSLAYTKSAPGFTFISESLLTHEQLKNQPVVNLHKYAKTQLNRNTAKVILSVKRWINFYSDGRWPRIFKRLANLPVSLFSLLEHEARDDTPLYIFRGFSKHDIKGAFDTFFREDTRNMFGSQMTEIDAATNEETDDEFESRVVETTTALFDFINIHIENPILVFYETHVEKNNDQETLPTNTHAFITLARIISVALITTIRRIIALGTAETIACKLNRESEAELPQFPPIARNIAADIPYSIIEAEALIWDAAASGKWVSKNTLGSVTPYYRFGDTSVIIPHGYTNTSYRRFARETAPTQQYNGTFPLTDRIVVFPDRIFGASKKRFDRSIIRKYPDSPHIDIRFGAALRGAIVANANIDEFQHPNSARELAQALWEIVHELGYPMAAASITCTNNGNGKDPPEYVTRFMEALRTGIARTAAESRPTEQRMPPASFITGIHEENTQFGEPSQDTFFGGYSQGSVFGSQFTGSPIKASPLTGINGSTFTLLYIPEIDKNVNKHWENETYDEWLSNNVSQGSFYIIDTHGRVEITDMDIYKAPMLGAGRGENVGAAICVPPMEKESQFDRVGEIIERGITALPHLIREQLETDMTILSVEAEGKTIDNDGVTTSVSDFASMMTISDGKFDTQAYFFVPSRTSRASAGYVKDIPESYIAPRDTRDGRYTAAEAERANPDFDYDLFETQLLKEVIIPSFQTARRAFFQDKWQ